ncbi:hypothetical protein LB553_05525 [Mesorhizobium sp. CA8]|uniref:hypothetical protein n=1 Tax=Mesorhizobium sp. CA8 TaxID=2876637 RepID=UPI001CD035A6|nr:hypothetical protein [Mesorhizobium sp. CA8]MBZ9760335.1 hypothetical protein [Mesorhizobium sp. CA8]
MPNTVRAAGEALPSANMKLNSNVAQLPVERVTITEDDIDRAYDVDALIGVCALAMEKLEEHGNVRGAAGDIRRTLRLVQGMAGASINALELAARQNRQETLS